jgi:hypothetical protein
VGTPSGLDAFLAADCAVCVARLGLQAEQRSEMAGELDAVGLYLAQEADGFVVVVARVMKLEAVRGDGVGSRDASVSPG